MHKIKLPVWLAFLAVTALSGCGGLKMAQVEKKYDEISKNTTCRLNNYHLKNEWGRDIFLNFEKEGANIKTIMQVHGIDHKYDFRQNPSVLFEIYSNDQLMDKIEVKTETLTARDWHETRYIYAHPGIMMPVTTYHGLVNSVMFLSKDDFKKMTNADYIKFTISENNHSTQGKLKGKELMPLKEFEQECIHQNVKRVLK